MPFIHIRAMSGRDMEQKKQTAEALVKAAMDVMGAPREAFTVMFEDVERENWVEQVAKPIIEPNRDKLLIERGEPV